MGIKNRIISFICAFCILIAGFGGLPTFAGTQSYTLLASDGNTYRITVTYNDASGIPEDAVLTVREITKNETDEENAADEPKYQDYVAQSVKLIGEESAPLARVFDITLSDPVTGEAYQPSNEVKVSIELLDDRIEKYYKVEVVHFHEEIENPELVKSTVKGESVEFKTDGFSVYVVISHEGGEDVETPRVEFHYINYEFETVPGRADYYSAAPYQFTNKHNEYQISQIVTNGETLEMIANPPNKKDENDNETSFFYGWYTVDVDREHDDTTAWDEQNSKWTGTIIYTWPAPQKVDDEIPVEIKSSDGTFKTNEDIIWTVGESSGTAKLDKNGTAHVYLVPMYSDFYFVNFHMGNKEADPGLRNNLLTRRLVVFGTSEKTTIRIGDIQCPSPDPAHQIFAGWETVDIDSNKVITSHTFYETLDRSGKEIDKTLDDTDTALGVVDVTSDYPARTGFYITIAKEGTGENKSIDLYPVFAEARWVNFALGTSGNGAKYVPSIYNLTNDVEGNGTAFTDFPTTERVGYDFGGWYVNAAMPGNDILNLDGPYELAVPGGSSVNYTKAIQLTGSDGKFVNDVKGKVFWQQNSTPESLTCGDSLPTGKEKLFEITSDGKLYTYKALDSIIASAKWNPHVVEYTVVYWLENANDDDYSLMYYKKLQGTAGTMTAAQWNQQSDTAKDPATGADYYPYETFKLQFAHRSEDQDKDKAGIQSGIQQKVIEGDNSTVVDVYYDRNLYTIRFDIGYSYASGSGTSIDYVEISPADANSYTGTVYGFANGALFEPVKDGNGGWLYNNLSTNVAYGFVGGKYIPVEPGDVKETRYYMPQFAYTATTSGGNDLYGVDANHDYVKLKGIASTVNTYTADHTYTPTTSTDGTQYALIDGEYKQLSFEVVGSTIKWTVRYVYTRDNSTDGTKYGVHDGTFVQIYYRTKDAKWYRTRNGNNYTNQYTGNRYARSNGDTYSTPYTGTRYTTPEGPEEHNGNTGTAYGRSNNKIYELTPATTAVYGWMLDGTEYTGTRYARDENGTTDVTNDSTLNTAELYYVDGNGGRVAVTKNPITTWSYEINGEPYTGICYARTDYSGDSEYTELQLVNRGGTLFYHDVGAVFGAQNAYVSVVEKRVETEILNYRLNGSEYTGTIYMLSPYTEKLYRKVTKTGIKYYTSYITNSQNYNQFLTSSRIDCGSTIPVDFIPCGRYTQTQNNTTYTIYYQDLTAKYGADISNRWPDSQPDRPNGYGFIGWITREDSYYWEKIVDSSLKGKYSVMDEGIICVGRGPNYTATTAENGIAHEMRCRYQTSLNKYVYRVYLWDPALNGFPSAPNYELRVNSKGTPANQAVPSYIGYTEPSEVVKRLITGNENNQEGNVAGSYSAYYVSSVGYNAMILNFYYRPNEHSLTFKYTNNDEIGTDTYFYDQSLVKADRYSDIVRAKTPDGYTFSGWYENPDGVGSRFNFNTKMPDGNIILYAVYKPIQFLIKINPNGAEIDHIDHTGASYASYPTPPAPLNRQAVPEDGRQADSGYIEAQSTFFFGNYGEKVGEYAVSRSYVPISDTASIPYIAGGRHVYAYLNIQKLDEAIDGQWGVPADLRDSLYVDVTYGVGQYKNGDESQGETEIYQLYKFFHDLIDQEYAIRSPGWWDCDGAKEFSFAAWKAQYAEKNSDGTIQLYRKCNSKENWVFLGWYKDNESMPYNFSDPVSGSFTLTAKWRLDGGYTIRYTPEYYLESGDLINGYMDSWNDPPQGSDMTYTDGAKTTVYKQPTNLTRNNVPVTDNSLIFRGWRVVSVRHTYGSDGSTIIATEYIPLENGVFYDPNDDYFVNVEFADSNNIIHMQAVYESSESSYRRPSVTNLTLDANSGYLTEGSTSSKTVADRLGSDVVLDDWNHVGTAELHAATGQITFGDIQNSAAVHLYRYATTIENDAAGNPLSDAKNYFAHDGKYFLIGFDEDSGRSDYIATYPADSIIAVTRNDDKTIYAIWEPMVYLTLDNKTDGDLTISLAPYIADGQDDSVALEVINVKDGLYERRPMSDYSNVTIPAHETLQLAFPKGAEKSIVISGTNTLGIGKALVWNSSVTLDEGGSYTTTTGGGNVQYQHDTHNHTLSGGEVKNTFSFSFNETLISNREPVTVTFTTRSYLYAMVLRDNWNGDGTGGGMQEYDYSVEEITADENGPKQQLLPNTSTRVAYEFLGWAYEPTATEPDFSASKPTDSPWTVPDLNKDTGFFQTSKHLDGETRVRELYAVWRYKEEASHVYVYKNVPDPGDQSKKFTFTLSLSGTFTYTYSTTEAPIVGVISGTGSFSLAHGEYAELISSNSTSTGTISTVVNVFDAKGNRIGDSAEFTAQYNGILPSGGTGSFNKTEKIRLVEATDDYYVTNIDRLSQVNNNNPLKLASSTDYTTNPLKEVEGNEVEWDNTDAGGTLVFNNIRKTKDIIVEKEYVGNSTNPVIFSYTASYTADGKTVNLGSFTVTSGTPNTEALKEIPLGAALTVTEATDLNYIQFVKVGGGMEAESTTVTFDITEDTTVYFKNILKSYPVKFIKVNQDGQGGKVEAFLSLSSSSHALGGGTLYASRSNQGVFYVSGGTNEPFCAGETYTLRESWVEDGFEGLSGPVTISVGNTDANPFTISDPKVTAEYNNTDKVWVFKVKNQEIKEVKVIKTLSDPLVTQRTFKFNYSYTFESKTVSDTFTLVTVSGGQSSKVLTIPVGATGFTVSEDTSTEDGAIARVYHTTYKIDSESVKDGNSASFATPIDQDHDVTFANTRKTVGITITKKVIEENPSDEDFNFEIKILQGNIPIKNLTVFDNGTEDTDDDWVTDNTGLVKLPNGDPFTLKNGQSKTVKLPVGGTITLKELLTATQETKGYAAFMTMPGVEIELVNGKADNVRLTSPAEPKEITVYNIPSICKVTDENGGLLYVLQEGWDTAETSDDVYIPAVFPTIKSAFEGRNYSSTDTTKIGGLGNYYQKGSSSKYTATARHQVEMLVDYQVPNSDVVTVGAGYDMVFTTSSQDAADGYPFRREGVYTGAGADVIPNINESVGRAVLTRVDNSTQAFFTVSAAAENTPTTFKMSDLIIDGDGANAQLLDTVKGGCLTAYNSDVIIDHCVIYNFEAAQGGAIFTSGLSLNVTNSLFYSCISKKAGDGNGGGAINTVANELTITDTVFADCSAVFQGGAVYHYGASYNINKRIFELNETGGSKTASLIGCVFENCVSRAGGGFEADVANVSLIDCDFIDCKSKTMEYKEVDSNGEEQTKTAVGTNGGGLNTYTDKFPSVSTALTLNNCHFWGCSAENATGSGNSKGGGGLHSAHLTNTLTGCTFGYDPSNPTDENKGCSSKMFGGGAAFVAAGGTVTLSGCDFKNCKANDGGAVYSVGTLTLKDDTTITSCTATGNGGGIYTTGTLTVQSAAKIESSVAKNGGAIYVSGSGAQVTISGGTISGNHATEIGGGAVFVTGQASITVSGGTIRDNYIKAPSGKNACGGAIYVENGNATIEGGLITRNYTTTDNKVGLEAIGGAIYVKGESNLDVLGGTISGNHSDTMTNGAYAGAIALDGTNVGATIRGGIITGNYAESKNKDAFGGAIAVRHGASLEISGGTISENYALAWEKYYQNKDRFANGGAIAVVESSTLTLTGGVIQNNYAENKKQGGSTSVRGAGVYLEELSTLNISGNPNFGDGNKLKTVLSGATNGGEPYSNPRQDIYIPAVNGVAPNIVVTGNISSDGGSIWVYAPTDTVEGKQHYKEGQQFAIIADGVTVSDTSLLAFHDAQDDMTSSGRIRIEYLTGIKDGKNVIWGIPVEGSRKVILRKVEKDTYKPIAGAKFTIYNGKTSTAPITVNGVPLANLDSTSSGVFYIGELPYGTYYIKETTVPSDYKASYGDGENRYNWFVLTVSADSMNYLLTAEVGTGN